MKRFFDFELVLSFLMLIACAVLFLWAFPRYIPTRGGDGLEAMLPTGVLGLLALLCASLSISRIRTILVQQPVSVQERQSSASVFQQRKRSAAFISGIVVYAVLVPIIGYVIASILLVSWFLVLMNERKPIIYLLVAVLPPFLLNYLLARVLLVRFTEIDNFFAGL